MPWDAEDASSHTKKAMSAPAKQQWSDVANSMLKRGASEGLAVRAANGVIRKRVTKLATPKLSRRKRSPK